jgi:putative CocE/NonD family hydrolase
LKQQNVSLYRFATVALTLLGFALCTLPVRAEDAAPAVDAVLGVRVPMRDGVKLNSTMWRPHGETKRLPAIVTLTPYMSEEVAIIGRYFGEHGYTLVAADTRGRATSEGKFNPLNESRDVYDLIEWVAAQPWCDGKVATGGPSYLGMIQWEALKVQPPHLVTMIPIAAVRPGFDFPIKDNIFAPYDMQWAQYTSGRSGNDAIYGDQKLWIDYFRALTLEHRAFADLAKISNNTTTAFESWLQHPTYDSYWRAMVPTARELARATVPTLTITGMYDDDQPGALEYYRELMRYAPASTRAKAYLVIGPWDHGGTHQPVQTIGGVDVGSASLIDVNQLQLGWYDWHLKGGRRPDFLQNHVAYYVTGPDEWRYSPSLSAIPTTTQRLYLQSSGDVAPTDAFRSGSLEASPAGGNAADRYTYDPLDTHLAEFERDDLTDTANVDQRYAILLFGNGLVYHSAPLEKPLEIVGVPRFLASISMDVPDTDFGVTLYEILPSGQSIMLTSTQMRARYRRSREREQLVKPGVVETYDFDDFTWMARRLAKGSRLRLVLTSPTSIYVERNYNSGGVVTSESGNDARTAHITLYHDRAHPSYLELPATP